MSEIVFKTYDKIALNEREAFRYMSCKAPDEQMKRLFEECLSECAGALSYKACWREFPLLFCGDEINLGFARTKSRALFTNLKGCGKIVLFAATVGHEMDRLIKKQSLLSPAKSVCLQAIGSERVESLCDTLNAELKEQYKKQGFLLKPRFSPGYGDLPLSLQREIMPALDCAKLLGINLGENLMMSPSKSVTAIIGVYK